MQCHIWDFVFFPDNGTDHEKLCKACPLLKNQDPTHSSALHNLKANFLPRLKVWMMTAKYFASCPWEKISMKPSKLQRIYSHTRSMVRMQQPRIIGVWSALSAFRRMNSWWMHCIAAVSENKIFKQQRLWFSRQVHSKYLSRSKRKRQNIKFWLEEDH